MPSHKWADDPGRADVLAAELCETLSIVVDESGLSDRSPDPIVVDASTRGSFIKITIGDKSRVFDATEGDSEPIAWMRSVVSSASRRVRKVR